MLCGMAESIGGEFWQCADNAPTPAYGARFSVVWMNCDEDSMRDYIVFRGAARDGWKITNWQDYLDTINPEFTPPFAHHSVDNRLNSAVALADQAREVAGRVQA